VNLEPTSLAQRDLQVAIDTRDYDALLYGISIGTDPDQFAYWHSSQADPRSPRRLNFSDYSSRVADSALEAGRTRIDPALRAAKYVPFLQAWHDDVPAYALYRPRFLYVTRGTLFNFDQRAMNNPTDRFSNIENWMIRTEARAE
jgi:peptide/nickel transport system substrate-binding protein